MEFRGLAQKINTFRLIQLEASQTHSKRKGAKILNISTFLILIISGVATLSTVEIALRTNTLWAALITLGIQSVAVCFFFIEPKYDHITTRLLLFSYLLFYAVVMFTHAGSSPFPLYWVFSYVLFAFVGSGGLESFIWVGGQFVILLGGIAWHQLHYQPKLETTEIRLFIYGYLLVVGFSFLLDHASKLSTSRVSRQGHELEEANARYDVILNSVGDGLIATDEKGIIEFVNREALELLKLDRVDLLGQPFTAVVIAKNAEGEPIPHKDRTITQVLKTGDMLTLNQASKERQRYVCGDGGEFVVGMVVSPVKVIGQVRGAIMLFHDMSVEDQIDRAKSEFVSLASHQLRTPLNVVSWYLEKLLSKRKGTLNEKQEEYLHEVSTNNDRMIRLVSDLLNVSRVELGRVKLKNERVDIRPVAKVLIKEIGPLAEQKDINFSNNVHITNGIFAQSDESIVTVVIQNLLSNAIKYTPSHGTVTINLTDNLSESSFASKLEGQSGVLISVQDSGIGIPKDQQDKIFSKLFRAVNVQSLDVSGTGLGLYVTQSFVESLGGMIWFESAESKGTTFYVFLPYTRGEVA